MGFRQYRISRIGFVWKSYYIHEGDTLLYKAKKAGSFFKKDFVVKTYQGDHVISISMKSIFGGGFNIIDEKNTIIGDLKNKLSLGPQKFIIYTKEGEYSVKGNFTSSEFTIYLNDSEIGKVSRKWSDSKNHIGIAVHDYANQKIIIGIVLAIIMNIENSQGG